MSRVRSDRAWLRHPGQELRRRLQTFERALRAASARPLVWLAVISGAALGVRVVALIATQPTLPAGDEFELFSRAARMAVGRPFEDDTARAPGILFFYASWFRLIEPWALVAKSANVVVGSLTVIPVFFLGRFFGGNRVGLIAAALAAGYPTFIAFSHFLWSEPLYIFLASSGLALLVWGLERPALWKLAAAGVVLGASALSKESGLLFPLLVVPVLVWRGRRDGGTLRLGVLRAGTFAGALVITLLPWMIHINEPGLPFAVITRTSSMNLYIGNHARSAGHGMREYASLAPTRLEAERVAREIALENIAGRMPAWPFEKIASEVPRFFTPTSFAVRRLLMPPGDPGNWGYRFRWRFGDRTGWRIAGVIIVVASYIGIVTTGMAGLLLARRRDLSALFLVFLASQILPSIVAFSMSRFRLPSMVVFIVGAASISVSGRRDWAEAPALSRWLAAGAVALIVCFIGADYESVLQSTGR